jgi:hypothetical protein
LIVPAITIAAPFVAATAIKRTEPPGNIQFNQPLCGEFFPGTLVSDCDEAVSQALAVHCTSSLCTSSGSNAFISETVGTCLAIVEQLTNAADLVVTSSKGFVKAAIPGFVPCCDEASQSDSGGASFLKSNDGKFELIFIANETSGAE